MRRYCLSYHKFKTAFIKRKILNGGLKLGNSLESVREFQTCENLRLSQILYKLSIGELVGICGPQTIL